MYIRYLFPAQIALHLWVALNLGEELYQKFRNDTFELIVIFPDIYKFIFANKY